MAKALRILTTRYVAARQSAVDLRTRLAAARREESHRAAEQAAQGELPELERIRRALERSAAVAEERVRAIEHLIAAAVREGAVAVRRPEAFATEGPLRQHRASVPQDGS